MPDCCSCGIVAKYSCVKYLGLTVDENLSWREHINSIKRSLRFTLKQFFHLRSVCPPSLLRQVYYALVNSKLEYGITLWGSTYQTIITPLTVLQKSFIRLLSRAGKTSRSFPLFMRHRILPVRFLYVYKVLAIFFRRSGNVGRLVAVDGSYTTRQTSSNMLRVPKPNCTLFQKSFVFLSHKFFNSLPLTVKYDNYSISRFKGKLRGWLFTLNSDEIENMFRVLM